MVDLAHLTLADAARMIAARELSALELVEALATHAIVTIVLPTDSGATMRIRKASTPESEHRELYRLLGVGEKIMPPKTIWSEAGVGE